MLTFEEVIISQFDWGNTRTWWFFPLEMPVTKEGKGPATVGEDATSILYEVWDQNLNTYDTFQYLPDAINKAMELNKKLLQGVTLDKIYSDAQKRH